jgi:hypothetical protein
VDAHNDTELRTSSRALTGVLCVDDHERICAVMCVLTRVPAVVLARRSVLRRRAPIGRGASVVQSPRGTAANEHASQNAVGLPVTGDTA